MATAAVSGSYRKHLEGLFAKRDELEALGVKVLFPLKSKPVNPKDEFVVLDTDETDDARELQLKNLKLIENCDFLYVYNPQGYVGASATLEIGYALKCGKQVISLETPADVTL